MIWSDRQTITLLVKGEEMKVEFKVPTALEFEELLEEMHKATVAKNTEVFKRFVTHIDGFESAEACVKTGGTSELVSVVSEEILKSATIGVELKN